MSTVTDKAREESDRVEAEEREREAAEAARAEGATPEPGDDDATEDSEPGEGEPGEGDNGADNPAADEPPEALAPAFVVDEKLLEKEIRRHDSEMEKVLGPEWATMEPCGHCGGMGAIPPDYTPPPEMVEDPDVLVCDGCNGYGERLTPSLHPSHLTAICMVCNGSGYRTREAIEVEIAQKRIMGELEATPPPDQPVWNPTTGQYDPPLGSIPPPPAPFYNQVTGRWELPADNGVAGAGVPGYPPPQG